MRIAIAMVRVLAILTLLVSYSPQACPAAIPHGSVELISENQWITPGRQSYLGLHFTMEPGWHTYWVNPGDSGQSPRATWQLPPGLTAGPIEWPTPHRLGKSTIVDYGYTDAVTLLVPVRASANFPAQQTAQLGADLKILICREICIPGKAQVSLTLPVKSEPPASDERTHELFVSARKSLPRPAPAGWQFHLTDAKESLVLSAKLGRRVMGAVFFPLTESQIDNSAQQRFRPLPAGFELTLRKSDLLVAPIKQLKGVLVLSSGEAYEMEARVGGGSATGK